MTEIIRIDSFNIDYSPSENRVTIKAKALIDNMVLVSRETNYEPEEWGPALCETTATFDDWEEYVRIAEEDLINLLHLSDCTWSICEQ